MNKLPDDLFKMETWNWRRIWYWRLRPEREYLPVLQATVEEPARVQHCSGADSGVVRWVRSVMKGPEASRQSFMRAGCI